MESKNKVTVKIAGKEYNLVGTESEEYMQRDALYVDKKITEITRNNNRLSTSMAAMLTAINTADDYIKAADSEKKLKNEIKEYQEILKKLTDENKRLMEENATLRKNNTDLQLELVRAETELKSIKNPNLKYNKVENNLISR